MRSIRDCCGNQPRASALGCAAETCKAGDPGRLGERNCGARNAWRMIGLDTNVVVRYFAQDHEQQSAHASALIDSLTGEEPGFISIVALIELVWVMQGAYKASKAEIVKILQQLLQTREIIVQDAEVVLQALSRFADSKAGFADCLIERIGHRHGCTSPATFDADAADTAGMRRLPWERFNSCLWSSGGLLGSALLFGLFGLSVFR